MHEQGLGDISLQFQQIKERLAKEGLFDEENKRPLPRFPKRIAVITSDTGAAVQDILNITARRFPLCEIMLCPVAVQGENAVPSMLDALERVYALSNCDAIIIGRGGGSIEDLWAFNSEILARKIYESPIPVISAVGHETDFTICDFVADLRAPTPSAAAELVVPDINEIYSFLNKRGDTLKNALLSKYNLNKAKYQSICEKPIFAKPEKLIQQREEQLDYLTEKLVIVFAATLKNQQSRLSNAASKLDALSPLKVLARGYSIAEIDNKPITSINDAEKGDKLTLKLNDGKLVCTVDDKVI
jgi:exodeoxyribonuclease VII large subunit